MSININYIILNYQLNIKNLTVFICISFMENCETIHKII